MFSLPLIFAICSTILFGFLAIYFSSREQSLKKELEKHEIISKRRLYEISTLRAIQDRIGYSLDIERVIDTLTGSLKNLFPYSTASSLIIEPNKLVFKTTIEETVSTNFILDVKKSMIASLSTLLDRQLPTFIEEIRTGMLPDNDNPKILASFFHIPLSVNGQIVGLINVSSTLPGLYKDADMTILYQMAGIASSALSRLKQVIETEEAKLLAMIGSLSDGLIFLNEKLELTIINENAQKLLGVRDRDSLTFADISVVLNSAAFKNFQPNSGMDISLLVKESIEKNEVNKKKIVLGDRIVQLFITPVVQNIESQKIAIGTTLILHDITLEESLNNLKEDFTNGIVHELRSPLTAIKYSAELLLTDKSITSSQKHVIDILHEQSKRMISDINSLLDAAKIESGKFSVDQKAEDIKNIIEEVSSLFEGEAEQKHVLLTSQLQDNLPKGKVDRGRISEVLHNLISNSLKYTISGGTINIKAEVMNNEHLPKNKVNPGILVSVIDTGVGIPIEKQQSLFKKFSQVGKSPIPKAGQGTGLGLYISKGIVEAHGGNIYLSSVENKGTTVSFTIPIINEENKNSELSKFLSFPQNQNNTYQ